MKDQVLSELYALMEMQFPGFSAGYDNGAFDGNLHPEMVMMWVSFLMEMACWVGPGQIRHTAAGMREAFEVYDNPHALLISDALLAYANALDVWMENTPRIFMEYDGSFREEDS